MPWRPVSWECLIPEIRNVFDPGGATVDYLSRCYIDFFPLIAGDSTLYPVRFYFTDKPPLPFPTIFFASKVWRYDWARTDCEITEDFFVGDPGKDHGCNSGPYRGEPDWFLNGASIVPSPGNPEIWVDCHDQNILVASDHAEVWYS